MLKTLFTEVADALSPGDYVRFTYDGETYEGEVLSEPVEVSGDTVTISLASEGDYGDRVDIDVQWDHQIDVLAQDYSDVEV